MFLSYLNYLTYSFIAFIAILGLCYAFIGAGRAYYALVAFIKRSPVFGPLIARLK